MSAMESFHRMREAWERSAPQLVLPVESRDAGRSSNAHPRVASGTGDGPGSSSPCSERAAAVLTEAGPPAQPPRTPGGKREPTSRLCAGATPSPSAATPGDVLSADCDAAFERWMMHGARRRHGIIALNAQEWRQLELAFRHGWNDSVDSHGDFARRRYVGPERVAYATGRLFAPRSAA